jgi:biopolymer transport protein ExbD
VDESRFCHVFRQFEGHSEISAMANVGLRGTFMKNIEPLSIRTCTLAAIILVLVSLHTTSLAQTTGDQKAATAGKWKNVEDVFGFPGANLPGDVIRFNMPRKDLHVTVAGTEIKPGLALGSWAAFHPVGDNDVMVMGDLVLTEDEVAPVMKALQDGGVEITALHNHLVGESPKIMYIHMGGHGDPVKFAQTIKRAVGLTKTPIPQGSSTKETADIGFDVAAVEKTMGRKGNVSGGVLHFNVPRAEKLTEEGMETPPSMGAGTAINFQPTGNGRAAIAGDFAMTGKEVGPVMKILQDNGIQAVALHSHALDDVPRLFYMHFWANDDAVKLAKILRTALDETNSAK